MKQLIIKATYGEKFIYIRMPKLFLKLVISEINKQQHIRMFTYIQDTYNIDKLEIINALPSALILSRIGDDYRMYFDDNIKLTDETSLGEILRLIDYGNREVRGTQILNNSVDYIQSRIASLYKLSLLRGDSNLWQ